MPPRAKQPVRKAKPAARCGKMEFIGLPYGLIHFVPSNASCLWKTKTNMPTARFSAGACLVNNQVFVIGGNTIPSTDAPTAQVERYNPATNTWQTMAPMPTKRCDLAVATVSGRIFAIGGFAAKELAVVEEFSPGANTWQKRTPCRRHVARQARP